MTAPKPKRPDYEIHQQAKSRMQWRVTITVASVAWAYFLFVLPQPLLEGFQAAVDSRWALLQKLFGSAMVSGIVAYILTFVLFSADSMLNGSNRVATWFRSQFAASAAVEKFGCSPSEAATLWFRYYDTWALQGSPNQYLMHGTYAATYSARAVFYSQIALLIVLFVTAASVVAHWKFFGTYDAQGGTIQLVIHILTVVTFTAFSIFLALSNKLPKDNRPATGCWLRVKEVFDRSRTLFVDDVLRHAETLPEAFERVKALRREHGGGG